MEPTPIFNGLTRDVTIGGLPTMYIVILLMMTMFPLVILQSIVITVVVAGIGYPALRAVVSYDPKMITVFITATQTTSLKLGSLNEKGFTYRA